MRMWDLWVRARQALANPDRSQSQNGTHDPERRRSARLCLPVKMSKHPAHAGDASQNSGSYLYVDNFR